jgi:threonine/homoserine/homoserine lactone efflux protein
VWKAFVFGAFAAGVIGPIALLIFSTGARQGFAAGAFAGLGAALADFLYAIAAFSIGAIVLPLIAENGQAIEVGGGLILVGLGAFMLLQQEQDGQAILEPRPAIGALWPTFLLTIVNPLTLIVFAAISPQLPVAGSVVKAAVLALALATGSALVQITIAGFGAVVGRRISGAGGKRAVRTMAALGIFMFGIWGVVSAL